METKFLSVNKRPYDEENGNSTKKVKNINNEEKRYDEEKQFFKLYDDILRIFVEKTDMDEKEIEDGIESIIDSFRYKDGNKFSHNDLRQSGIFGGYLYRYGPHGAGLARMRTMNAITNCNTLKNILKESELNILSLGGGPGNDIIGFCSALYDFNCHSKLNLTITDSVQRFSSCINILEFLIREGDYGNISKVFNGRPVNMSFMQLTLPDYTTRKSLNTLKEADIIVMSKLFSILEDNVREDIIQNLYQNMKPRAVLLYIDSPFYPELWKDFNVLYQSESEEYVKSFITNRFGHNDRVFSKAQIAVLRKKEIKS